MAPMKIVISDDEPEILEFLKPAFEDHGYEVFCASTGSAAIKAVESENPDAVLTDIRMPDGTGVEFLRRLRRLNSERKTKISVFVMTGFIEGGEGYLQALGVEQIWVKPFPVLEVVASVTKAVLAARGE